MNVKLQKITLRAVTIALSVIFLWNLSACGQKQEAGMPSAQASQTQLPSETEPAAQEGVVEYNGSAYRLREDQQTVLIMGLDKYERPENSIGYTNKLQADFLMVLVIDETAGECQVLQLNRDTMTEIRRLGIGGAGAGTFIGQLALAHTYGSGGSDSCLNAAKAVSTLLGGVKIDHYVSITMEAVGKINDAVGGVTLTLMDDFSDIDPSMQAGQEVTLEGDQALTYVRSRAGLEDSSNLHRMERQQQYMSAFYAEFEERSREDENFLAKTLLEVSDDFVSDCTINQLSTLGKLLESCTMDPIRTIEGEAVLGEEFIEFYVDADSLQDTIFALFYEKV